MVHVLIINADQSAVLEETEAREKKGTLRQMLEAVRQPDSKILNVLPVPLVGAGYEANSFSSDHAAWMQTLSAPFSKDMIAAPIGDLRWGSCAMAGAFDDRTTERIGLGTIMDTMNGSKWWICGTEPTKLDHTVEGILLEPGTRL